MTREIGETVDNVIRDMRLEYRAADRRMREIHRRCIEAGFAYDLDEDGFGNLSFRLTPAGVLARRAGVLSAVASGRRPAS